MSRTNETSRTLRRALPWIGASCFALIACSIAACTGEGGQGDGPSQASSLTITGFLAALVGFVLGYFVRSRFGLLSMPPGPSPRLIKIKKKTPVVIFQVELDGDIDGAEYKEYVEGAEPDNSTHVSRIIVSGPANSSKFKGLPYVLPIPKALIDKLNDELTEGRTTIELIFDFYALVPPTLYTRLSDALKDDEDAQFRVSIECWYYYDGKYLLSTEDRKLGIHKDKD